MEYEIKAIAADGEVHSLKLSGPDEASAAQQAESRGFTVLTVVRRRLSVPLRLGRRRFPLTLFSQETLVLLKAGLPLVEIMETLAQRERNGEFRSTLERIITSLRQGVPFSEALAQHPSSFPGLYVSTVQASEKTSDLATALARYVAYETQLDSVRKRLVNASIYPLLLMAVGALVAVFLLLFVVPRFSHIYEERGGNVPAYSRLLLAWGKFAEQHGTLVVAAIIVLVAATIQVLSLKSTRSTISEWMWRLPMLGERLKTYQLARFYRTIGMLLRGGIPLVNALEMGQDLLHSALRERLSGASRDIREGQAIARSMESHGLTTPVAMRLLNVGERGGNMGEMMDQVATFHDEEISRWVDWFSRLFEPLLMAFIGLIIGTIVVLMYMPIFELASSLE